MRFHFYLYGRVGFHKIDPKIELSPGSKNFENHSSRAGISNITSGKDPTISLVFCPVAQFH